MELELKKALQLEGYLEKKSPSIFKGYQKRHFAVHKDGTLLVYSKKRILSKDVKPKGVIPIEQISQIAKIRDTEREFILQVGPRQILLRAESKQDRELWTSSIAILQEVLLEKLRRPSLQAASKESFVMKAEPQKLTQKASWKELDQETKALIMMDKEKQQIQEHQEEQDIKTEEILKSKGLYAYLEKFDPQKFNQFVKCGFLYKKGKIAKLTKAKKRFFILISSVSLLNDDSKVSGPTQSDIPDTFKLNHLYYFAYDNRGDQSSYLGKIAAEHIEDFEMMDVDRNSNCFQQLKNKVPYGFKFSYKQRSFHLFSESLTEIQGWVLAIRVIKEARINPHLDEVEDLKINKEDIMLQEQMQVKVTRKIIKDRWRKRMVYMKKNSLTWAALNQDDDENYVLIISIKSVVGQENDFHIYTKDEKIYKFRTNSEAIKDEWMKKIEFLQQNLKGEFKDLEKATELPPEQPIVKESSKSKSIEKNKIQPDEIVEENKKDMADFYDNFFKSKKEENKHKQNQQQKEGKSFFSKIFCCCPGDHETDRGF